METQLVLCFLPFVTVTVNVFFFGCDTTQRLNSNGYIKVIAHSSPTKSCHVPLHFLSTLQRFRHLSLQVWLFLSQCQQSASLISISSQQAAFFEFRWSNSLRFVWVFLSAWLKAWNSYYFRLCSANWFTVAHASNHNLLCFYSMFILDGGVQHLSSSQSINRFLFI